MGTMSLLYYIKPGIISIAISADEFLRAIPVFLRERNLQQ